MDSLKSVVKCPYCDHDLPQLLVSEIWNSGYALGDRHAKEDLSGC